MYCIQCGNPIDPNSNFCTRCGTRVTCGQQANSQQQQAQAAPAAPAARPSEKVLWVFQAQRKYSMVKMAPCNIVFMQDKVVLAHLTPAIQKAENARVSQQVKAEGKGFFKGSAQMMRFWAEYHKKYYDLPVSAILAEDPSNVVIDNPSIARIFFRGFSESLSTDDSTPSVTQGKLELTLTNKETIKFTHSQSAHKSIQELLYSLFGERLKYKK